MKGRQKAFIAVAGLLMLSLARPALIMGFSGDSLGNSLRDELSQAPHADCDRLESGDWSCTAVLRRNSSDDYGSIPVYYAVSADPFGCWEAKETDADASSTRNAPARVHGCIDLWEL